MNKRQHGFTDKQKYLLRYLYEFRRQHGDSPTLKMIVIKLGLSSNKSVIDMIRLLVKNGYLVESATKISRSTVLTEKALEELNLKQQLIYRGHTSVVPKLSPHKPPRFVQTISAKKTLEELNLKQQLIYRGHTSVVPKLFSDTQQSTQVTNAKTTLSSPNPKWPNAEQPNGSNYDSSSTDVMRSLSNVVSFIANAGTANRSHLEPTRTIHPFVFFTMTCITAYLVFGSDIKSVFLISMVTILILQRSVR